MKRNDNSSSARKKFSLNSIIIQSPLLKKALGTVFANYEGVTTDLKRLKFKKPFAPFIHRWEKFQEVKNNETDETTKKHLELLWDTLEFELRETIVTQKDLIANGVITHDYLWTMLEPGCLVLQKSSDFERVVVVQSSSYDYGAETLEMKTLMVEWDGEQFGMESEEHKIDHFEGTRKISELSMVPLLYHDDSDGVQQRCIARGRSWEQLCGYHFKAYKGVGTNIDGAKFNIESRIIIVRCPSLVFSPIISM